ncbi:MAG TPA: monofunctional biosynthetic peptidoglycan transglycosylase, partial [Cytophagaceae bacterium]
MKRKLRRVLAIIRLVLLFFFTQSVLLVVVYRFFPPPVTPLMLIRVGEQILDGKKIKLYKDWEPLENISPKLVQAVVASEDQRFLEHNGFDFKEIKRAIQSNKKKGRKIRGASTISQQVAKNVFLWPSRSWLRKGLEVYFTVLIEVFWTKERIMEVYLNVIEMGNGVYG